MNSKTKVVVGILIFAALLLIANIAYSTLAKQYSSGSQTAKSADTQPIAPDFSVFDVNMNVIKLSDFKGKPVILNFWASWCPPCQSEMPHFNEVYADSENEVVFMMVDLVDGSRETQAKGQKYVNDHGYKFPVYFDVEQKAASAYGISSIPTTFFIDANGAIVKAYRGAIDKSTLLNAIASIKK